MHVQQIETIKEFGGWLNRYQHESQTCHCTMTFSVYLPPQAQKEKVPAVYWLSGLTCTDDNFRVKAGAQRYASELGLDMAAFEECIESGRYAEEVQGDFEFAANLGVRSTPTFFVNGLPLVGAQPFEVFKQLIDSELAGEIPK